MTIQNTSSLESQTPTSSVSTEITIGHVQLRDLVICPHERGVVNYLCGSSIYEQDIYRPGSRRALATLGFIPNPLAALPMPESSQTLMAAGGQDADLHLSMHPIASSSESRHRHSRPIWSKETQLFGSSINNSVMLTKSHASSAEPRLVVSNNDCTVKFFDVHVRGSSSSSPNRLRDVGSLKIDVPVNHSSVSPDGSTLLSVGDSPQVHLHHLSGSSNLSFQPIIKYSLAPFTPAALSHQYLYSHYTSSTVPASFSTSFSSNGTKFAVASQEGVAVVWDVRSSKPLKVFGTDKSRGKDRRPTGEASGWLYEEDLWDWSRGGSKAPGWGIRSIKFSPADCDGREIMTFTEHTSLFHVIDARTFETEEVIRIPDPRPKVGHRYTQSESAISCRTEAELPQISVSHSTTDSASEWEEEDGLVIVPRLGSSREEDAVRRTLVRHGIRTARPRSAHRHIFGAEDEMDMTDVEDRQRREADVEMEFDDAETECLSSAGGSRAGSPIPISTNVHSYGPPPPRTSREYLRSRGMRSISSAVSGNTRSTRPIPSYRTQARMTPWAKPSETSEDTLDLAGTCFDPTGSYIYVGSTKGIVEYKCRGAEKRWYTSTQWA